MPLLDPDRLFPIEPSARAIARELYAEVRDLPIVSPHGHTDPRWYAEDAPFPDPAQLFVVPDHYVFRMLHSQGVPLADLGVPRADGGPTETDGRAHLAPLRRELPPAARHAVAALARPHLRDASSASTAGSRPRPPTTTTTTSPTASPARSSGPARSSSASASR